MKERLHKNRLYLNGQDTFPGSAQGSEIARAHPLISAPGLYRKHSQRCQTEPCMEEMCAIRGASPGMAARAAKESMARGASWWMAWGLGLSNFPSAHLSPWCLMAPPPLRPPPQDPLPSGGWEAGLRMGPFLRLPGSHPCPVLCLDPLCCRLE